MAVLAVLGLAVVLLITVAPQWWVKRQIKRYSVDRSDFPGTGGELAQHLVEHFGLEDVSVEMTDKGDHYDPEVKVVRLSEPNFHGRSVSAVAIAAHEIGHAIQHDNRERGLMLRQWLLKILVVSDGLASAFFVAAPVLGLFLRTPAAFFGFLAIGVCFLGLRLLVAVLTLPVEFDASFGKALPILRKGGYLQKEDIPAARSVLRAAALTYVAAAAMNLVNLARWVRVIR